MDLFYNYGKTIETVYHCDHLQIKIIAANYRFRVKVKSIVIWWSSRFRQGELFFAHQP
jgi:hypothetical protein